MQKYKRFEIYNSSFIADKVTPVMPPAAIAPRGVSGWH